MMALAHLLEHPVIGAQTMSTVIGGLILKRSNKDLGRVLAIARLSDGPSIENWPVLGEKYCRTTSETDGGAWRSKRVPVCANSSPPQTSRTSWKSVMVASTAYWFHDLPRSINSERQPSASSKMPSNLSKSLQANHSRPITLPAQSKKVRRCRC